MFTGEESFLIPVLDQSVTYLVTEAEATKEDQVERAEEVPHEPDCIAGRVAELELVVVQQAEQLRGLEAGLRGLGSALGIIHTGPGDLGQLGRGQAAAWRPNVMATEFVSQTIDAVEVREDVNDVNNNKIQRDASEKQAEGSVSDLDEVDVLGGTIVVTEEQEVELVAKAKECKSIRLKLVEQV
jgi:hypothetical protein